MTTHIMSMTYGPKIEGVRNGTIRQTIRRLNPERPFELGDEVLIHGWAGKPYRSPWDWRLKAEVQELDWLKVDGSCWAIIKHDDLIGEGHCTAASPWGYEHGVIDGIAKADGIEPPTGCELKAVLERFHGPFVGEMEFQVIRW
jgi:hypothetical protein